MKINDSISLSQVLLFKNKDNGTSKQFIVGDEIIMIYEDYNDGDIEIKGMIVGFNDYETIIKSREMDTYYYSNIKYMTHNY